MDSAPFELPGGGRVLFTARAQGNLATPAGTAALCERWGLRELVHARQVHGSRVQRVGTEVVAQADGHLVAERGVAAMVLVADCLPVALGSEDGVAILHAGWRGLAGGILEQGVQALRELGERREGENGQRASEREQRMGEIVAVVGPGAGVCCYEVGEEVHSAFAGAHRHGRQLDLRALAHERLHAAGVTRVADLAECTICSKRLFSYRREGTAAGRQAGVVWRLP
jgi:copper oxidase (laccase) domain-containing protein